MIRFFAPVLLAFFMIASNAAAHDTSIEDLLTVAEDSNFESTATSAEVVEFVEACASAAPHVRKHVFGQTVEGRDMVAAVVSTEPYVPGDETDQLVSLVFANIHSGECCGKEALLMLLRELTANPDHPWLEKMVVVLVPNYNADANDRMGPNNRPGQVGPVNGMGRRENAQELDLNRDFGKLESPEARSLISLMTLCDPDITIDCHTTNGSQQQYALTYAVPVNPACSQPLRDFMRNKMMPEVTETMEQKDWFTFYYGNFNQERDRWMTYGMEPRYSTDYVGLRGKLSVLSEAYAYISFEDRIKVTRDFVTTLLDYVAANEEAVETLLAEVEDELIRSAELQPERIAMAIDCEITEFDGTYMVKGFKDGEPHDYECKFLGCYEPTITVQLPYAYLIPAELGRIAERLQMHGARIERLESDTTLEVEQDTITTFTRDERAFQKHRMASARCDRNDITLDVAAGTYVVRTAQPLGRLISYMLEPQSNDGFVVWNFFDEYISEGETFPVLRIGDPVELPIAAATEFPPAVQITLDMIDGPNSILQSVQAPSWYGQTNTYESTTWGRKLLVDAETDSFVGRVEPPASPREVSSMLTDAGVEEELAGSLSRAKPTLSADQSVGVYKSGGETWIVRYEDRFAISIGSDELPAEQITFNAAGTRISWHNLEGLHTADLTTPNCNRLTVEAEDANHLIGKLDWVYQEELYGRGNFQGHWWSPDEDHIAFLELDETELIPFIVMDHIPVRGNAEQTNYPKAGDPLPGVRAGVLNSATGDLQWIDTSSYGDIELLISRVSWSDDGQHLYLQIQNREQTWLDLVRTRADGSSPQVLFRDQTPAWIESPGDPVFLADGSFLWVSPGNGYKHIYHYAADGQLKQQLTSGEWEVRSLQGVSADSQYAFFHATKDSPINIAGYRINIESGQLDELTSGPGMHRMNFSHDMSYFINAVSTATTPTQYSVHRDDGSLVRQLRVSSDDRLKYLGVSEPEILEIPTDGDQPMDAMIIKPPNFDPNKKYPVLVYIYGGPQAPRVRNSFGGEWYLWHQMLAQQGFVIWMCDGRSSSYRSTRNVWPIYKNFAELELADIETGVEWLKQNEWVDSERIGIWGWSYGGYMTAYALCHSQTFSMGISGAPVTDWKNYDAIYTERYMDLPQNNPEGYERTSLLPVARDLHGRMLLIHGEIDDNVHINNTMQLVYELQKHNKQFDLMVYPKARHSVRDDQQQAHLRRMMYEFVIENL